MSCDATFWNGILCSHAAHDTFFSCEAIYRAQSPNGQLWRSPWEAAAMNSSNPNFFSRDQGLGTLLSLLYTKNLTFYQPWYNYINISGGRMCPKMSDCLFSPPFWCTFHKVAAHVGLPLPPVAWMFPDLGEAVCKDDHEIIYISTVVNENGSALHLASLDVLIRRMMGDWDDIMQKVRSLESSGLESAHP